MDELFRLSGAVRRDPAVDAWFSGGDEALRMMARPWFERMRDCGDDVTEILHDGHPIACVGDIALGYVDAFSRHVNVGFFRGVDLDDPTGLLEGTGVRMRHVKIRWGQPVNEAALSEMITAAYADIRARVETAD